MLESHGLTDERVRREVVSAVGLGDGPGVHHQIPFTPLAKELFELARHEANDYNLDFPEKRPRMPVWPRITYCSAYCEWKTGMHYGF